MRRFAADGATRMLSYEGHMEGGHVSARKQWGQRVGWPLDLEIEPKTCHVRGGKASKRNCSGRYPAQFLRFVRFGLKRHESFFSFLEVLRRAIRKIRVKETRNDFFLLGRFCFAQLERLEKIVFEKNTADRSATR